MKGKPTVSEAKHSLNCVKGQDAMFKEKPTTTKSVSSISVKKGGAGRSKKINPNATLFDGQRRYGVCADGWWDRLTDCYLKKVS